MDISSTPHDDGSVFVVPKMTLSDVALQTAEGRKTRKIQLQPLESQTLGQDRQRSVAKSILLVLTVTLAMVVNVGSTINFFTFFTTCVHYLSKMVFPDSQLDLVHDSFSNHPKGDACSRSRTAVDYLCLPSQLR